VRLQATARLGAVLRRRAPEAGQLVEREHGRRRRRGHRPLRGVAFLAGWIFGIAALGAIVLLIVGKLNAGPVIS
jgi:hypothetical protein